MNISPRILLMLLSVSVTVNILLFIQLDVHVQPLPPVAKAQPIAPALASASIPLLIVPDKVAPVAPVRAQVNDLLTLARELFKQQKFVDAVALYGDLLDQDQPSADVLQQQWQAQVNVWFEQKAYATIERFHQAFLTQFPYNTLFLALEAQRLTELGEISAALEIYYSLSTYAANIKQQDNWLHHLQTLAKSHIDTLKQQLAWQALLDFSQPLLSYDADYAPYRLALALAQLKLSHLDEAQYWLTGLLDDPFYQGQAQEIAQQISQAKLQQIAIPLKRHGENYTLSANINQNSQVQLLLDTGASTSVISSQMFEQISIDIQPQLLRHVTVNTAGGEVYAPVYQVDQFSVNDFSLNNFQFVVLDMGHFNVLDGLLGMNFLKEFKFQVDQQNALLILSYK